MTSPLLRRPVRTAGIRESLSVDHLQPAFVFAPGMLPSLAPATALILNEDEIIDLASSKTGTWSFAFDKVSLKHIRSR
jgi:hypothetical protein